MIRLYYLLVLNGIKTIEEIPEKFRAEVQVLLNS
jgi:hypothetical protein